MATTFSPGTKITKDDDETKTVAVIGYANDWAAYQAPSSWSDDMVARTGDKIWRDTAEEMFPEIKTAGLRYRP